MCRQLHAETCRCYLRLTSCRGLVKGITVQQVARADIATAAWLLRCGWQQPRRLRSPLSHTVRHTRRIAMTVGAHVGFRLIVVLLVVVGAGTGCSTCLQRQALVATAATDPQNDRDVVIGLALRRAVIEEKDIPCYEYLTDKTRIIICSAGCPMSADSVGSGALPLSDTVSFILLTPTQIDNLAFCGRGFTYLAIGQVKIDADEARVRLGAYWAPSPRDEGHASRDECGSALGYELVYHREGTSWIFVRPGEMDTF